MKHSVSRNWAALLAGAFLLLSAAGMVRAAERLKPFILVSNQAGDMAQTIQRTKAALTANGFQVVGEYEPYANADIIIVTSPALKEAAAKTAMGGYGAIQRVAVTKVKDNVQVAYTNPVYMDNAYRMQGDLSAVAAKLAAALGAGQPFGSKDGVSARKLRKYHYMFGMPYFDDPYELGEFDSYQQALKAVNEGLAQKRGGVSKVYQVDIPGKNQAVIGVHMTKGCSGDKYIMDRIDFAPVKSTPHLPYELLVSGKHVYALHAKFRIAESFPDLSMIGHNSFFSIMCAPDAIGDALKKVVGTGDE
jgi:hypothetical protein